MLHGLLSLEEDVSAVLEQQSQLSQILFDICLKVKCVVQKHVGALYPTSSGSSVKLPKLFIPVFDGNIGNCCSFWEQFTISVRI